MNLLVGVQPNRNGSVSIFIQSRFNLTYMFILKDSNGSVISVSFKLPKYLYNFNSNNFLGF